MMNESGIRVLNKTTWSLCSYRFAKIINVVGMKRHNKISREFRMTLSCISWKLFFLVLLMVNFFAVHK